MKVFGIDPGSERTGYGCVQSDGRRHRLVLCGAIRARDAGAFPDRLAAIHDQLTAILRGCRPDCVAIENLFHAANVRSALKLGHARGVAMLAAVQADIPVVEYTPAEIKRAVVGYGRADKGQVQRMIKLLLGLDRVPEPHDAADALAVAICHLHAGVQAMPGKRRERAGTGPRRPDQPTALQTAVNEGRSLPRSWRLYRPRGGTPHA